MSLRWVTFGIAGLFVLFVIMFELLPGVFLLVTAFTDKNGFTLANFEDGLKPIYIRALRNSSTLALWSALQGAVLGTLTAGAMWSSSNPRIKRFVAALSGVAANFAGVPLAFAFIVILGTSGVINLLLESWGLPTVNIFNRQGLYWVYLYFQWPLMTALMLPAFAAIDRSWLEAVRSLGGSPLTFWLRVGVPVLLPTLLGSSVLLFANAFGAYATVYAIAQGDINLLPVQIGFQVSGQVDYNPGAAAVLALLMAVVLLACLAVYRVSGRWAQRLQGGSR